jgi:FtsP/CotA-like multicopper oxidase with cupredoxin domain
LVGGVTFSPLAQEEQMHIVQSSLAAIVLIVASAPTHVTARTHFTAGHTSQRAIANDNRTPAGTYHGDTLVVRLVAGPADWHILSDSGPAFSVLAFGEEGKPLTIPGPLIRVKVGTPVHVSMRNAVGDTLIVRGLQDPGAVRGALVVPPGQTGDVDFVAGHQGTYFYWGTTATAPSKFARGAELRDGIPIRPGGDSQLSAALIIDPPGPVLADRIFVITGLGDSRPGPNRPPSRDRHGTPFREFMALNGKTWPYTERFTFAVGDTVRWRIVNASFLTHPMHLHGFYFRVDSHWARRAGVDSIYSIEQRRMAVTEPLAVEQSVSIVWSPDRPGGWIFHCHFTQHAAKLPPVDQPDSLEYPTTHDHGDPDQHVFTGMNGLVTAINVTGAAPARGTWRPARRLRLFVQSDSAAGDSTRRFGYVLQRGSAEPRKDSVEYPGPVLVLTRGEPTSIEVVNRSGEPTAVHWHGIELESYYDGVVGWGGTPGMPGQTTPAIRSGSSFDVHITPRRAGTFMYHTHLDDMRQQYGGLVGALLVLEPGERFDPTRDLVFLVSDGVPQRVYINGSLAPPVKDLVVGTTYRIRIANLAVYRPSSRTSLRRDSSLVTWRPVAKDGFALPASQAVARPSIVQISSGETADFEFTPDRPGDVMLEVGTPPDGRPAQVQGSVRLRVSTKAAQMP